MDCYRLPEKNGPPQNVGLASRFFSSSKKIFWGQAGQFKCWPNFCGANVFGAIFMVGKGGGVGSCSRAEASVSETSQNFHWRPRILAFETSQNYLGLLNCS